MSTAKIAITMETELLKQVDQLVKKNIYPNRSKAIQLAVEDKLKRLHQTRLAKECAKLDLQEEQNLAEEGMNLEINEWPEY